MGLSLVVALDPNVSHQSGFHQVNSMTSLSSAFFLLNLICFPLCLLCLNALVREYFGALNHLLLNVCEDLLTVQNITLQLLLGTN